MNNETKMKVRILLMDIPAFLILAVPVAIFWGLAMVGEAFREHVEGLLLFGKGVDDWNRNHPEDPSPNEWF